MNCRKIFTRLIGVLLTLVVSQLTTLSLPNQDPLPSWNEGKAKNEILAFVNKVSNKNSPTFINPADRIAVLDLDGTLMVEHPINFQRAIAIKKLRETANTNPALREIQPWKSAWTDDPAFYNKKENHSFVFLKAFENHSHVDYISFVEQFLNTEIDSHWGKPFQDLIYKPARELISFLKTNGFHVFICSNSEEGCLRVLLQDSLKIQSHEVIGNKVDTHFSLAKEYGCAVFRMKDQFINPENAKEGKCHYILHHIGKNPVFVFGNSMGDCAMLKFAKQGKNSHFSMILDHDDPQRELEYHDEDLLKHAKDNGWLVISMKKDFKEVY